jgi:hypothetical protein
MKVISKLATAFLVFSFASNLFACSVCFGDPNSPMTHGAKVAVFFLLGVIGVVLGSIVGVAFFWVRRARLVTVQEILHSSESK